MAIERTDDNIDGTIVKGFQGLSTDTKPTNCGAGSTFWELDKQTGRSQGWIYSAANINPETSDGWWPI